MDEAPIGIHPFFYAVYQSFYIFGNSILHSICDGFY